jgi:putative DNA primase/helicase
MVSPEGELIVAARAVEDYRTLLTVQRIAPDGTKRFLRGARARGAIHVLGERQSRRQLLCEGYATGVSLHLAAAELWGSHCVIVTFSANNLLAVASHFPHALVCADHDASGVGEQIARETGHSWVMPPDVGTDFNDVHRQLGPIAGRRAVMEMIRKGAP